MRSSKAFCGFRLSTLRLEVNNSARVSASYWTAGKSIVVGLRLRWQMERENLHMILELGDAIVQVKHVRLVQD